MKKKSFNIRLEPEERKPLTKEQILNKCKFCNLPLEEGRCGNNCK